MTPFRRWAVVALGVALVVGAPVVVAAWPADDSGIGASDLLREMRSAEDHPWSGFVETHGTLELPVADDFDDVGALFSGHTRLRAWWRSSTSWRVDRLETAGEVDLLHAGAYTTEWSYEADRARVSRDPQVRLPRTADLVPPVLAARVLLGVDAEDTSRVPARRVAGIDAPGLRVRPTAPQASIDHVDLWADPATGVVLRVEVHATASGAADFTSELEDYSSATPSRATVTFAPTDRADVSYEDVLDIADAANQYAPLRPPSRVGGLAMSGASDGAVGVYGAGLTQLIAVPLRDREAGPLRDQLRVAPGARRVEAGTSIGSGPLGVLLTGDDGEGGWLITGTVTADTLDEAAADLAAGTTFLEDDR